MAGVIVVMVEDFRSSCVQLLVLWGEATISTNCCVTAMIFGAMMPAAMETFDTRTGTGMLLSGIKGARVIMRRGG